MCTCKFWQLKSNYLRDTDDIIFRFLYLENEEKVWKYHYICKILKETETKYTVMGTGWKALPVG